MVPYREIYAYVQQIAPTWRKTQHENFARVIFALLERENLALSDLARALPEPTQRLHGRLKRLDRFLTNPRLDEAALFARWLRLSYRFGEDPPPDEGAKPLVPLLLDTVYFEPFAELVCTVPCGSRGLPIALTTYHRQDLDACFPPRDAWPPPDRPSPPRPRRPTEPTTGKAKPRPFLSQNRIEEELVDYVFVLLSSALRGVIVADRGFARAEFMRFHQAKGRSFVIRIDAQTHLRLPRPLAPDRPAEGLPAQVLGIAPGQTIWCPLAFYAKEEQVPIALLAVWDPDQKEPWYLASNLDDPAAVETLYRWRMRLECTNRDEKTGVILREGGDAHALRNVVSLHRLLLALAATQWLLALVGLQALHDLPLAQDDPASLVVPPLPTRDAPDELARDQGPAPPPPIIPRRGDRPKTPAFLQRFVARGPLSYVRLGREVLRSPDLLAIPQRLVRWLAAYLWSWTPLWHPLQVRYRLRHWWADTS